MYSILIEQVCFDSL